LLIFHVDVRLLVTQHRLRLTFVKFITTARCNTDDATNTESAQGL